VFGQWHTVGIPCGGGGSSQRRRQQRRVLDFTLLSIASAERNGTKAEAACWAGWSQLGRLLLGHKIRTGRAEEERAAWVSLGQNREYGLGCQKRIEKGFGILAVKLNLNQDNLNLNQRIFSKLNCSLN
jgi:hypothetical protein